MLTKQVENAESKKRQVKKEYQELQTYFDRITDPEIIDKTKAHIEYLEEMIRGEAITITKLNKSSKAYQRLDFVAKEVAVERQLVGIEDELNLINIKCTKLKEAQK